MLSVAPPRTRKRELTPEDQERGARIRALILSIGWTPTKLADAIKIRPSAVSKLLSGETMPLESTIRRIHAATRANPNWILTGIPPMLLPPGEKPLIGVPRRTGQKGHPALNRWLRGTDEGQATTRGEREWLRGCPWPEEAAHIPDESYALALRAFRTLQDAREDA